jgi:hypothetical protein
MAIQSPLHLTFTRWLLGRRRSSGQGFTLTELLVSLIMGTLIMGSLLYLVVELLGVNAKEESLTRVQQDTRRALDYMSREVQEAVFVYANPTDVTAQLTDVGTLGTAVMAFWKLSDIEILEPTAAGTKTALGTCPTGKDEECGILRLRQSGYSLVVYFVQTNNAAGIWAGPRRIIRYELSPYAHVGTLTLNTGYRDPTLPGNSFESWTRATGSATTDGDSAVLTDGIDAHNATATGVACPSGLTAFPTTNANNFFTCINTATTGVDDNKTIYLFLRGSIAQNDGSGRLTFGPIGTDSALPTLSTEVQIRGVLERSSG